MQQIVRAGAIATLVFSVAGSWTEVQAQSATRGKSAVQACALLSPAEIARVTGRAELASARPLSSPNPDAPDVSSCGFLGTSLHIHFEPVDVPSFKARANDMVKSGPLQTVAGVGDAAWFQLNSRNGNYELIALAGSGKVTLSLGADEGGAADAGKATLLSLMKVAVANLSK